MTKGEAAVFVLSRGVLFIISMAVVANQLHQPFWAETPKDLIVSAVLAFLSTKILLAPVATFSLVPAWRFIRHQFGLGLEAERRLTANQTRARRRGGVTPPDDTLTPGAGDLFSADTPAVVLAPAPPPAPPPPTLATAPTLMTPSISLKATTLETVQRDRLSLDFGNTTSSSIAGGVDD